MAVYKRYKGKRISSSHTRYADARWWIYKRLKGKTIHQSIPEAKTKQEAELAERQIIKAAFDHIYNLVDTMEGSNETGWKNLLEWGYEKDI